MNTKTLKCPNCGAEVPFSSPGTLVVVCAHCAFASRRTDVALESIGKVAMPAELLSHFRLGTRGSFEGEGFVVRGQLQLDHGAGPWNEWCASTARGWLWLAEAQGRVSVLRPREARKLPAREALAVGSEVELDASGTFVVSELGEGTLKSAAGELPIALEPGARTSYADLSRAGGGCATLDWTRGAPEAFVGRFVEVAELALEPETQPEARLQRVAARRLACKNCGGALELLDPETARTVVCPSCNTVLDVGSEAMVAAQAQKKLSAGSRIRLGLATKLRGEDVLVMGFLHRAVKVEGVRYPWSEYLLRTARGEYRWLVENNGHWLLATPIEPGAVKARSRSAVYQGTTFRHFDGGKAQVQAVLGEFYWAVRVGDETRVDDYIAGGRMVSLERDEKELAASLSVHLDPAEVAQVFQLQTRPARRGVGPLQPAPWRVDSAWAAFALAFVLLLLSFVAHQVVAEDREVLRGEFGPAPTSASEEKVDFSEPFEVTANNGNVYIAIQAPELDNGWLGVDGALVNESSGAVTAFALAAQYYHGISEGESWSEGNHRGTVWLGPVPAGRYRMRLACAGFDKGCGEGYTLRAVSDVPRPLYFVLALLFLLILPAIVSARAVWFESQRWSASAHPWGES